MAIRPKGEGKMRRSLIKILVLALILSVMLTALNYEPRANYDPEEKRFACIINYGFNYWTGVQNGAEEAGEDDNVSIDVYSFELMDTQRQIQLIPVMIGSTFAEFDYSWNILDGKKNEWTEEETMANLTDRYGDKAQEIADEFAKVFPDQKLADAYFYSGFMRETVAELLSAKLKDATAPVYSYLFDYEAPVNGGGVAFHCSELIYAFHNVDIPVVTRATGGGEDAHKVQDVVATAWLNFAKTGSPSQDGLEWKPYTEDEQNTMVLKEESECRDLGDETLRGLIMSALGQE